MKKILIIVFGILLFGCNNNSNNVNYQKIMNENEYVIVDVRTEDEYNKGHLVEAINVPYDEIEEDTFDKDKMIFVYCRSGNRSGIAFNYLTSLGYTVYDLGSFSEIDLPKE